MRARHVRHAILRADASATVGTGHVVRCRTLAEALIGRGWRVSLVARALTTGLDEGLVRAGIGIIRLPADLPIEAEPDAIADQLGTESALVVGDHYGLDAAWFETIRGQLPAAVLLAIDDLADRPLPVDIVLNPNLGATTEAYANLVPPAAHVLTGPTVALLRPEFAGLRDRGRPRDGRIERILVFFSGGADESDLTGRAVDGLGPLGLSVDVVVGSAYRHLEGLRAVVASQPASELHVDTDAMAELMAGADLAIGAASSASWERCALGLPAVLVTLADNQRLGERALVEAGAALTLGWHTTVTTDDIAGAVRGLGADRARVRAMATAAAAVTDGRGTQRVVAEIEEVLDRRVEAR